MLCYINRGPKEPFGIKIESVNTSWYHCYLRDPVLCCILSFRQTKMENLEHKYSGTSYHESPTCSLDLGNFMNGVPVGKK